MHEPINQALRELASSDAEGRKRFASLPEQASIDLLCAGMHIGLYVDTGGVLQVRDTGQGHAQISTTPAGALRALGGDTGGLSIEGEAEAAQQLFRVLQEVRPDWALLLARVLGDGPAGLVSNYLQRQRPDVEAAGASVQGWAQEVRVSNKEYAAYVSQAQDLRLRLDTLEARLKKLLQDPQQDS